MSQKNVVARNGCSFMSEPKRLLSTSHYSPTSPCQPHFAPRGAYFTTPQQAVQKQG